jgi:hypothetical protein
MLAYSRRRGTWKKFSLGAIEAVSGKHIVADSDRDSDTQAGRIEIFDAIVDDAGVPGLYQLYRLREQGLKQRCVQDAAVLAARASESLSRLALRLGERNPRLFVL